jgi:hypothetical protein
MLLTTFRVPALIIVAAAPLVLSLPLDSVTAQSARPLIARTDGSEGAALPGPRRNPATTTKYAGVSVILPA